MTESLALVLRIAWKNIVIHHLWYITIELKKKFLVTHLTSLVWLPEGAAEIFFFLFVQNIRLLLRYIPNRGRY